MNQPSPLHPLLAELRRGLARVAIDSSNREPMSAALSAAELSSKALLSPSIESHASAQAFLRRSAWHLRRANTAVADTLENGAIEDSRRAMSRALFDLDTLVGYAASSHALETKN